MNLNLPHNVGRSSLHCLHILHSKDNSYSLPPKLNHSIGWELINIGLENPLYICFFAVEEVEPELVLPKNRAIIEDFVSQLAEGKKTYKEVRRSYCRGHS